ncbi:MAG: SpoIIE family protein phosphatase [Phycisphaerae bacterium]
MARLRYFDDHHVLRTCHLGQDKLIIGRVESCHLVVVDDLISREHARVDRDPDGRYRIRDLGSRNKTFVNGQQINETLLTHGDMVRIGHRVFEYIEDALNDEALDLSFITPDRNDPPGTEWVKIKSPVTLPLSRYGELAVLGTDAGYPARAEDVASAALGRLLLVMGADRGFVALRGESSKSLQPVAHRGLGAARAEARGSGVARMPVSQTFVYSALLQAVAGRYPQKAGQIDAKSGFAATALIAPLLYNKDVVGVVYLDLPSSAQPFPASAVAEIAAAGAHIGALMADASQRLVSAESALGPAWSATLRRMQLAMTVPPTSSKSFQVSVKLLAGRARCGDFCDIVHVSEERVFVLVLDAGGAGVAGFVQAGGIRTAVRTALTVEGGTSEPQAPAPGSRLDIAAIMSAINRTMTARQARQLVTCTLVDIDLSGGQIHYVNAGGPPPLMLVGQGRMVTLDQPALVLGIDPNYGYEASAVDLPSSFRLICHTDGLPEMANAAGEALGSQRLHDLLLEKDLFGTPAEIIQRIVDACERHRANFPISDDALIAVISH